LGQRLSAAGPGGRQDSAPALGAWAEVMVHPGLSESGDPLGAYRRRQMVALCDPALHRRLDAAGVRLRRFAEIRMTAAA